jgi:outer membrane protein assembly factor BamB
VSSDVCTPLYYQGRFYILNGERQTKTIARVDPATGKPDWIGELEPRAKIECSPTGADGKIYFQNFKGEVFIVAADKEFKVLHTIPMGDDGDDRLRATIPVADGNLFIRTGASCIAWASNNSSSPSSSKSSAKVRARGRGRFPVACSPSLRLLN